MTTTPIKLTVDTGKDRYDRYGYVREITDRHIILDTPAAERFATAAIPLISVVDMEDATAAEVEAHPRRPLGRSYTAPVVPQV